jgi:predicted RNA-binding Zn-ribbon protein involved in translation (DUF1610 family)
VLGVTECKRQPVYNLTVDDAQEFFANGVLVHNCDSFAYAVTMADQLQSSQDWAYAYGIHTCHACGHLYVLRPTGYTVDRPCPKCGAAPIVKQSDDEEPVDDTVTIAIATGPEILVDTDNPDLLAFKIKPHGGELVLTSPGKYAKRDGHFVVRAVGDPELVRFTIENQQLGVVA